MILLPFYAISLAADIVICAFAGREGWMLAIMAVLIFVAAFIASLLLYVLILGLVSLFVNKRGEPTRVDKFSRAVVLYTIGIINALFRVRIHTEGFEKLPEGRWLYVSNHRSAFDALTACWAMRKHGAAFIMKPGIMKIPIANVFLKRACFLPIDRENDREALKTIIKATQLIKADEASIAVYPEGTRNRGESMLPFRNGVFKIVQRAKVPLIVASVRNSEKVLRNFPLRHTDVYLKLCRVFSPEELEGLKTVDIGEEARKSLEQEGF